MGLGTASGLRKVCQRAAPQNFYSALFFYKGPFAEEIAGPVSWYSKNTLPPAIATLDNQDMALTACGHNMSLCSLWISYSFHKIFLLPFFLLLMP